MSTEKESKTPDQNEGDEVSPAVEGEVLHVPSTCREVSIEIPTIKIPDEDEEPVSFQDSPAAALKRYLDNLPQHPSFRTELRSVSVWRGARSELFASFFLTILSAAASLRPLSSTLNHPRILSSSHNDLYYTKIESHDLLNSEWEIQWALSHGLAMGALTWAIRTAHFSLATTISLFVSRKISLLRLGLHGLAQLVGSIFATPILLGLLPRPPRAPILTPAVSGAQGWGAEFLATALVSLISLSSYEAPVHRRGSRGCSPQIRDEDNFTPRIIHGALLPLIAAHTTGALFVAGITGIGLNPARSLAIALLTGEWEKHWIWWIGPVLGGMIAAFTHEYTGARDSKTVHDSGVTPRPSIVPRDSTRRSFLSSVPTSPS